MNYMMSDVHGEYYKFLKMLDLIKFNDNDTLYILGDIVDRGENPIELVQHVMNSKNIKMCLGNHEDMMLQAYHEDITEEKINYIIEYINRFYMGMNNKNFDISNMLGLANWIINGGEVTARQFLKLSIEEQKEIVNFFENLPLFFEYENYIFSHAGLNLKGKKDVNWIDIKHIQNKDDFIWSREEFFEHKGLNDKIVIFGHTPGLNSNFSIWIDPKYKDKICIDCGAAYGGKLGCICLDNNQTYYV